MTCSQCREEFCWLCLTVSRAMQAAGDSISTPLTFRRTTGAFAKSATRITSPVAHTTELFHSQCSHASWPRQLQQLLALPLCRGPLRASSPKFRLTASRARTLFCLPLLHGVVTPIRICQSLYPPMERQDLAPPLEHKLRPALHQQNAIRLWQHPLADLAILPCRAL